MSLLRATGLRRGALMRPIAINESFCYQHNFLSTTPNRKRGKSHIGVVMVPHQYRYIVEYFGQYQKTLEPGLHFLLPIFHKISYVHSLREETVSIPSQAAITKDNVAIHIDGVLYYKITDPYAASYAIEDPQYALINLAQTTMRSELGKQTLDETFRERDALNQTIVAAINQAAMLWGMECLRYEIRDIAPPQGVKAAMDLQAEAERKKRARVLESEAERQSEINIAEGQKQAVILASEGSYLEQVNRAKGAADSLKVVASALENARGRDAVVMRLAEQYLHEFGKLAHNSNSIVVPSSVADVASMISQAVGIYQNASEMFGHANAKDAEEGGSQLSHYPQKGSQEPGTSQTPAASEGGDGVSQHGVS
eukprot:Rmarinus@m.23113